MQVSYYSDWRVRSWTCAACGWKGTGREADHEQFNALMELNCAECFSRLALVLHPDEEDLRRAAAAGVAEAVRDLEALEADRQRPES